MLFLYTKNLFACFKSCLLNYCYCCGILFANDASLVSEIVGDLDELYCAETLSYNIDISKLDDVDLYLSRYAYTKVIEKYKINILLEIFLEALNEKEKSK